MRWTRRCSSVRLGVFDVVDLALGVPTTGDSGELLGGGDELPIVPAAESNYTLDVEDGGDHAGEVGDRDRDHEVNKVVLGEV